MIIFTKGEKLRRQIKYFPMGFRTMSSSYAAGEGDFNEKIKYKLPFLRAISEGVDLNIAKFSLTLIWVVKINFLDFEENYSWNLLSCSLKLRLIKSSLCDLVIFFIAIKLTACNKFRNHVARRKMSRLIFGKMSHKIFISKMIWLKKS